MVGNDAMPDGSLVEHLTGREREVLGLLAEGFSAPEIAVKLTVALSQRQAAADRVMGPNFGQYPQEIWIGCEAGCQLCP